MKTLRIILGDQLSESIAALRSVDKDNDTVMICEVIEEATYVPHHPKKIAFLFSAMRHFAKYLQDNGINVRYIKLDVNLPPITGHRISEDFLFLK
jgi:deoxyribodipyrimidine photolyase-related protein